MSFEHDPYKGLSEEELEIAIREGEKRLEEEMRRTLPPSTPLYFDPETMSFLVGETGSEEAIGIAEAELGRFIHKIDFDKKPDTSTLETLLITPATTIVITPAGRKGIEQIAASEEQKADASSKVYKVMQAVYRQAAPRTKRSDLKPGHSPWSIELTFQDSGRFLLRTLGDCACLEPAYPTVMIPQIKGAKHDTSVSQELTFHNVETRAELLSLLAGAATVGFIAKQRNRD